MHTRVSIYPGICGETTLVTANHDPKTEHCTLQIESSCSLIAAAAARLQSVIPADERSWEHSQVMREMRAAGVHTNCPVPAGVLQAMNVASGKKEAEDATIHFLEPNAKYFDETAGK